MVDKVINKISNYISDYRFRLSHIGIIISDNERNLLTHKDRYVGCRVFIIGNGPSLNKIDMSLLKDEITIGCNGLFLKFEDMGFLPTYYTVEDTLVAEDRSEEINKIRGTTKIFPLDLKYCLEPDPDTLFINFKRPGYKGFPQFSDNLIRHAYWGGTVTFLSLQIAWYIGAREVYLIGIDHNYKPHTEKDVKDGFTITSKSEDLNHFHPDYFGPGYRYHDPKVERMELSYIKAKNYFERNGGAIYNATIGGKLELFPRVSYGNLFRNI